MSNLEHMSHNTKKIVFNLLLLQLKIKNTIVNRDAKVIQKIKHNIDYCTVRKIGVKIDF